MKIKKIETFTDNKFIDGITLVRISTDNNYFGWGQISPYNSNISTEVFHRQVAPYAINENISHISKLGELINRIYEKQHKFPGTYLCRALGGLDTAIWDLHGKIQDKPVCDLIGKVKNKKIRVYASSMKRDITPEDEVSRMRSLRETYGFNAFKFRIGSEVGRDKDEWDGRTEEIIKKMSKEFVNECDLLVDANSCYSPKKAIEIGKMLIDHGIIHYEEPCPYWKFDWTQQVTKSLEIDVTGGEQDNNLTLFKYMIKDKIINIVQPDILYLGGIDRSLRLAKIAESYNMICTPHAANLSLVSIFTLHFLAAINNAGPYLEFSIEGKDYYPWQYNIFDEIPKVVDGHILIDDKPGWGIKPRKKWIENSKYKLFEKH